MRRLNVRGATCLLCVALLTACAGEDGADGADGANGTNGTNGTEGVDGTDGIDGTNGTDGVDGTNGTDGVDGTNGTNGTNGTDGIDGTNGTDGVDGTNGVDGADGQSGIIDRTQLTGQLVVYDCLEVGNSGIDGQIRFAELKDGTALVSIVVSGTSLDTIHAAHIHQNSAVEGGAPLVTLNSIDGLSGVGETLVGALNDGTPITYAELLDLDAFVNVHVAQTGGAVCAGDVGGNELTGDSESYDLSEVNTSGISAVLTLEERKNGNTLATLQTTGDLAGTNRAAHFHPGTVAVPGTGALISLTAVDATTGLSHTNVRTYDAGSPVMPGAAVTYDQLLMLDAYVNVHTGPTGGASVASGDVGGNVLTGNAISYDLDEANTSGITGTADFEERLNGNTLVTLTMVGDLMGTDRAAHIHPGSVATPGTGALISLTPVSAVTNVSRTEVKMFDATSPVTPSAAVTYDDLLTIDAYLNVHIMPTGGAAIAAGDIGSNAP